MAAEDDGETDRGPGSGPDACVICGGDASHTLGRHCSSECVRVKLRREDRGLDPDQSAMSLFAKAGGDGRGA